MSTYKSQNLNLHLWEPEDNLLRTEFNENFAALDAAAKAEADKREVLEQRVIQHEYVVGSFVGNGGEQTVYLGFRPSLVIVAGQKAPDNSSDYRSGMAICMEDTVGTLLLRRDNGFWVHYSDTSTKINRQGVVYAFVAFR